MLDDPIDYFSRYFNSLIVLDEVQRMPEIFPVLRGQIDQHRRAGTAGGRFLIVGSASMDLLHQSPESLAGRISYFELTPLTPRGITANSTTTATEKITDLDRLWLRGGFPLSYMSTDEAASLQWRLDFIRTYLERDLPLSGLRISTGQFERFWRMIAYDQGELFIASRNARSLNTSPQTIVHYLEIEIFEKLLMIRRLRPWYANTGKRLVKSPRPFL